MASTAEKKRVADAYRAALLYNDYTNWQRKRDRCTNPFVICFALALGALALSVIYSILCN